MKTKKASTIILGLVLLAGLLWTACEPANQTTVNQTPSTRQGAEQREPTIEASPTSKSGDEWQVINAGNVTLNVTAPGAQSVKILYRPAFAEGRHVELRKISAPTEPAEGKFTTQLKVPTDFAGDVWAEVSYPKGDKKETKPLALTTENISVAELADADYKHSDESARSDKITGGKIETTSLEPGKGDIRITVNVPAFQLTLWQGGKEVKTYRIGIGRREFPLPNELRHFNQIVFNPDWVPPDSSWVVDHDVEPGERIEADDPRNPLGKIKVPLGNGILIHQALGRSDLGHLVSHGCVRLPLDDLFDLSEKIIAARALPVSKKQIDHAKTSKDRLVVKLDAPIVVDINYDTQVVEGGVLHLYPDVYNHQTNTVGKVREALQAFDASNLDDSTLRQMLSRVKMTQEFAVSLDDIKSGRVLESGQNQSLTAEPIKRESNKTGAGNRRHR